MVANICIFPYTGGMTNTVLTQPQKELLASARDLAKVSVHGLLVSGHAYRTGLALERKGFGRLKYQGPSLGWFHPNPAT